MKLYKTYPSQYLANYLGTTGSVKDFYSKLLGIGSCSTHATLILNGLHHTHRVGGELYAQIWNFGRTLEYSEWLKMV